MNTARHTTLTALFEFLDGMLLDTRKPVRMPVRPQDRHDDIYEHYESEASVADSQHQQEREER